MSHGSRDTGGGTDETLRMVPRADERHDAAAAQGCRDLLVSLPQGTEP